VVGMADIFAFCNSGDKRKNPIPAAAEMGFDFH